MTIRKQNLASFLIVTALLLGTLPAASAASSVPSGSGTAADPFLITSASELAFLDDLPDACYKLARDITLTDGWTYIEDKFTGVLDGDGHTIRMEPNPSTVYPALLFYYNAGTIKNLCIEGNLSYSSPDTIDCGLLVYSNEATGVIENCSARGSISIYKQQRNGTFFQPAIGGLAARNQGTVRNCYSRVDLSYDYAPVSDSSRSPSGYVWYIGGIVGENRNDDVSTDPHIIENCYFAGTLPAKGAPIAVSSNGFSASGISGCYFDEELAGKRQQVGAAAKSTLAMKLQAAYQGWDFDRVWYIDPSLNGGYPVLRIERQFNLPSSGGHSVTTSDGLTITFGDETPEPTPTPTPQPTPTPAPTPAPTPTPTQKPAQKPASTLPPNTTGGIRVYVNGVQLSFDQPPEVVRQRTMVPVRAIFEALGAEVSWDSEIQCIMAIRGGTVVTLWLGSRDMIREVNGGGYESFSLEAAPYARNGRTLVPVRAIAEAFDCDVQWDGATQTVTITG